MNTPEAPKRPDLDAIEKHAESRLHQARRSHIRKHHEQAIELCAYIRHLESMAWQ